MKMSPASPANGMCDGPGRDAVLRCDCADGASATDLVAKHKHRAVGECGPGAVFPLQPTHKTRGAGVSLVLGVGYPRKVRRAIVLLDPVDVVHFWGSIGLWHKGSSDEPVKQPQETSPVTAKPNKAVSGHRLRWREDVRSAASASPDCDAPNAAQIRHFVGGEAVYGLPVFTRRIRMSSHAGSISNEWAVRDGKPKPWKKGGVPA